MTGVAVPLRARLKRHEECSPVVIAVRASENEIESDKTFPERATRSDAASTQKVPKFCPCADCCNEVPLRAPTGDISDMYVIELHDQHLAEERLAESEATFPEIGIVSERI